MTDWSEREVPTPWEVPTPITVPDEFEKFLSSLNNTDPLPPKTREVAKRVGEMLTKKSDGGESIMGKLIKDIKRDPRINLEVNDLLTRFGEENMDEIKTIAEPLEVQSEPPPSVPKTSRVQTTTGKPPWRNVYHLGGFRSSGGELALVFGLGSTILLPIFIVGVMFVGAACVGGYAIRKASEAAEIRQWNTENFDIWPDLSNNYAYIVKRKDTTKSLNPKNIWFRIENDEGKLEGEEPRVNRLARSDPGRGTTACWCWNFLTGRNDELYYDGDERKVYGGNQTQKLARATVRVLGRDRIVTKIGRTSYVTYEKQQVSLSEARKLEKAKKAKKP